MQEAELGYPLHRWLAIGHMAEAESEILSSEPEIARLIREKRKLYEADPGAYIDVLDLIKIVSECPDASP